MWTRPDFISLKFIRLSTKGKVFIYSSLYYTKPWKPRNRSLSSKLYMYAFITLRLIIVLIGADFVSVVMLYFSAVFFFCLCRILARSGISPFMLRLLFSRGMLVFLLFCSLLLNSKASFSWLHCLMAFFLPSMIMWSVHPVYIQALSYAYIYECLSILLVPTLLLVTMSLLNLEVTLRL